MPRFRAAKAYHFSTDGTEATTWAHFVKVPGSEPAVYEFETGKQTDVAKLRKLTAGEVDGYDDITEVEADKPKRGKASQPAAVSTDGTAADGGSADPGVDGAGDTGAQGD